MKVATGRIIMYDWLAHEMTSGEDFVVSTGDPAHPYIRLLYKPYWGFDAPPSSPSLLLNRWAFVGRGAKWTFQIESSPTDEQEKACKAPAKRHRYEDEQGKGELDRYVATPGGKLFSDAFVAQLPCLILRREGMSRATDEHTR